MGGHVPEDILGLDLEEEAWGRDGPLAKSIPI